jgi:hypothetical protein
MDYLFRVVLLEQKQCQSLLASSVTHRSRKTVMHFLLLWVWFCELGLRQEKIFDFHAVGFCKSGTVLRPG